MLAGWTDVLGVVSDVQLKTFCSRDYALLSPPSGPPPRLNAEALPAMATLLLAAPDEHSLSELKHIVPQALHSLREAASSGTVLAGAGLTELYLAEHLKDRLASLARDSGGGRAAMATCVAAQAIAGCLQDVAACLPAAASNQRNVKPSASPGGLAFLDAASEILQQLRAGTIPPGLVYEAEMPKRSALLGALDLAGILLRLGATLDFTTRTIG